MFALFRAASSVQDFVESRLSTVGLSVPKLAALYQDGKLMLDELMSAQITLDQVNQAMDNMGSGEIARSVIVY